MKRYLIILLALGLFAPAAHAQYYTSPYQSSGYNPYNQYSPYVTSPYSTNPYITNPYVTSPAQQFWGDLSVGSQGADVSEMQTWLIAHGFDIPSISSGATAKGYFGVQTKVALQAFQRAVGLSDTGIFGPTTRERMRSGYTPTPVVVQPTYYPQQYPYTQYPNNQYPYNQYPNPTSVRPSITGVEGPTSLVVGQSGTWVVRASNAYDGALTYSVDWGDNAPLGTSMNSASLSYSQSTSFTHIYNTAGTYTVRIVVRNINGYTAETTITVQVIGQTSGAGNLQITSPNGGENWLRGSIQQIRWTAPYYFRATAADLRLVRYNPCSGPICPAIYYAPYTIASNISINQGTYSWNVGYVIPEVAGSSSLIQIADGEYYIQVCERGTSNCDMSNGTFNIYSSGYPR